MEKMIGYCGINCGECGTFIATLTNDYERKVRSAQNWTNVLGYPTRPEDINCEGCTANGRIFGFCAACEIRKCARERKVTNCAYCIDYACSRLTKIHAEEPEARARLGEMRKTSFDD